MPLVRCGPCAVLAACFLPAGMLVSFAVAYSNLNPHSSFQLLFMHVQAKARAATPLLAGQHSWRSWQPTSERGCHCPDC